MPLSPRSRFELINWLAQRYDATFSARRILTQSNLNPANRYNLNQAPFDFWTYIVDDLDRRRKVARLLLFIVENESKNDLFIRQVLDELQNSYSTKLEFLAKSICTGQCILFLGPAILRCVQNDVLIPFNQALSKELVNQLNDDNIYFDPNQSDNLNYIAQRFSETKEYVSGDQGRVALKLFNEHSTNQSLDTSIYTLLAELPFKIIINTNPDEELAKCINQGTPGKCITRYYDRSKTKPNIKPPLDNNSILLYNILGSFANPLSILTTESQLLNFTRRIIEGTPSLDKQVRLAFNEDKYYLFLGFDFDQWYIKIVLEMVLRLVKQKDRAFSIFSNGAALGAFNREFYEEEFKFYFIQEDAKIFVIKLLNAYKLLSPVQV